MVSVLRSLWNLFPKQVEMTATRLNEAVDAILNQCEADVEPNMEHSLLGKPLPALRDIPNSPLDNAKSFALSLQREKGPLTWNDCNQQFIDEISSLELFENLQDVQKDPLWIQSFLECYEKALLKGPVWIPLNDSILMRVDAKSHLFTLFNNGKEHLERNQSAEFEYECPLDGSLQKVMKYKKYTHYRFQPEKQSDLLVALANVFLANNPLDYFYQRVIPFAGLKLQRENDHTTYPERYQHVEQDTFLSILHYTLLGAFRNEVADSKEADRLFEKSFCEERLNVVLHKATLSHTEAEITACIDEYRSLIFRLMALYHQGALTAEFIRALKPTYLDLQGKREVIEKARLEASLEKNEAPSLLIKSENANYYPPVLDSSKRKLSALNVAVTSVALTAAKETEITDEEWIREIKSISFRFANEEISTLGIRELSKELSRLDQILSESPENLRKQQIVTEIIKKHLNKIIIYISVPSQEKENFWNNIEDSQKCLKRLDRINKTLWNILTHRFDEIFFEGVILNYQLLACIDHLSRKNPKLRLEGFQTYHFEYFKLLAHPQCVLERGTVQQRAFELALYYDPKYAFHRESINSKWPIEEYVQEVQGSAFALISIRQEKTFFQTRFSVTPLIWDADDLSVDCMDRKGQTYAYYKQFIEDEEVKELWNTLGEQAPKTESEKVLWIALKCLEEELISFKEIGYLQKTVARSLLLNYGTKQSILHPHLYRDDYSRLSLLNCFEYYPNWRLQKNIFKLSGNSALYASSQNKVIKEFYASEALDYLQIWCNPFDSINRWVGYLFKTISHLDKPAIVKEFSDALFQFKRLEMQLRQQPAFLFRLKALLRKAIFYAQSKNNYELISDLYVIADKLFKFVNDLKLDNNEASSDIAEWIHKDILPYCNSPKDKFWAYLHLCKKLMVDGRVQDPQKAVIYAGVVLFTKRHIPLEHQCEMGMMASFFKQMMRLKHSSFAEEVFNAVAKIYELPQIPSGDRGLHSTGQKITYNGYTLDLDTFDVKHKGESLCHNTLEHIVCANDFKYYYGVDLKSLIQEEDYLITLGECEYCLHPKGDTKEKPTYFIGSFSLNENQAIPSLEREVNGKRYVLLSKEELKDFKIDPLWLDVGQSFVWQEKNSPHLVIESPKESDTHIYGIADHKNTHHIQPVSIVKEGMILIDGNQISAQLASLFSHCYPLSTIQFWKGRNTDSIASIRLPISHLSFSVRQNEEMHCDQFHGYYLISKSEAPPLFFTEQRMLCLKNHRGDSKLLMIDDKGHLSHIYDCVDGIWKPRDIQSCLYLIQHLILQDKWLEACKYTGILSKLFALSNLENKFLKSLLSDLGKVVDNSKADVLKLKLELYKYEQVTLHTNDAVKIKDLIDGYLTYLGHHHLCLDCELSKAEEISLLTILISHYDELLAGRIYFSVSSYWTHYVLSCRNSFFKKRLVELKGGDRASYKSLPQLYEESKGVVNTDITVTVLRLCLEKLSGLDAQTLSDKVSEIKNSLSALSPPSNDYLRKHFFVYYKFICEEATPQERADLAKVLWLVEDYSGLVEALRNVCLFPEGRVSLASLLEDYQRVDSTKSSFISLQSTWSSMRLYFRLWSIVKFQWIRYQWSKTIHTIHQVYSYFSATLSASVCTTRAFPQKTFSFASEKLDCSAIDNEINAEYAAIVDAHFNHTESEALDKLIKELSLKIEECSTQLKSDLQKFILVSNAVSKENDRLALQRSILGRHLDDKKIFAAFASASSKDFMSMTAFVDSKKFDTFLTALTIYYIKISRLYQLKKAFQWFQKALPFSGLEREKFIQEACRILRLHPAYKRSTALEDRTRLAQEVLLGFMATSQQNHMLVDALHCCGKEAIIKSPPGSGKSVLIRNALSLLADMRGEKAVNILPSMQEATLTRQLSEHMEPLGRKVVRIHAFQEQGFSIQRLEHILRVLRDEEHSIVASAQDVYQWLEIHMKLHCYRLMSVNPVFISADDLKKLQLYLMILGQLKVNVRALFEESHIVLSRQNKLVISLDGHTTYHPRYAAIACTMMQVVMQEEKFARRIRENTQENLTRSELNELNKLVADHFASKWKMTADEYTLFTDFVLTTSDEASFQKAYDWVQRREYDRDKIVYLMAILNIIFPVACKGRINAIDGYRRSRLRPNYLPPVPCAEKKLPKEQSNFHHDVALFKAFFNFQSAKISLENAEEYIDHVHSKAERQADGNALLDLTRAGKSFSKLIKRIGLLSEHYPLSAMQGNRKKEVAEKLKESPYAINLFVQDMVSRQIEVYHTTIEADAVNLQSTFSSSVSLSATPLPKEAHGLHTVMIENEESRQEMEDLLLNNASVDGNGGEARIVVLEEEVPEKVLEECAKKIAENLSTAIVESIPVFNMKGNGKVAALFGTFLEPFQVYEGVLFCDEKEKIYKVYDIKTKTVQTLTEEYDLEKLFKLYTETEACNTDWVSVATGLFEVIIGPKSTWEIVAQAAGRARLSRILQTISFVMRKEMREKYFGHTEKLTSTEIVNFLKQNTQVFNALNILVSIRYHIENESPRLILNKMCGLGLNPKRWSKEVLSPPDPLKALDLFRAHYKKFVRTHKTDPWATYSSFRPNKSSATALREQIKNKIDSIDQGDWGYFERAFLNKRYEEYSKLVLPEGEYGVGNHHDTHVQVLRLPQSERQICKQKDITFQGQEYPTDIYPSSLRKFMADGYRPSRLRHFLYRVALVAKNYFSDLAYNAAGKVPIVFMLGLGGLSSSFLITDQTLATQLAVGSLAGIITALAVNCLLFSATLISHLGAFAFSSVNVTYDTHYLRDVLKMHLESSSEDILKVFQNSNVMISNNKLKLWIGNVGNTSQIPFMPDAKSLYQILVIYHKSTKQFELIDIDMEDSRAFYKLLEEDRLTLSEEETKQLDYVVGIYDVEAESMESMVPPEALFAAVSQKDFDVQELLANPAFHQEVLLIKQFNGYLECTAKQKKEIPLVVNRVGKDTLTNQRTLQNFLVNEVLPHKKQRDAYPQSELAELLES